MAVLLCILFVMLILVHLFACATERNILHTATKPLLMPLLALWYALSADAPSALVIAALLCGAAGDTFLLFPAGRRLLFGAGVLAFAVGHVLYILYMLPLIASPNILLSVLFALVFGAAVFAVYRHSGSDVPKVLRPGLLVYMSLLAGLGFFAGLYLLSGHSALALIGALFFMFSDYLLLIQTFRREAAYTNVMVMLTYCVAQLLLMLAFR